MAPKLKGKELAAFKKAEKAQFEEIALRYRQGLHLASSSQGIVCGARWSSEELIVETMEKNKKEAEAKAAYEAEQAWLKAERERLADEAESMKPMFKKHHDDLSKLEAAALAKKEWDLFMDTSGLPQAAKEATINTYLEVGKNTLDPDYNAVLKSLVDIYKSAGEAEALALQEDQKEMSKRLPSNPLSFASHVCRFRGFMQKLEKLGIDKMDRTTNYLLQKSYSVYRETERNIVTGRVGDWKLAIWINHVKNPRFRMLELPELDIYINLPKSFALANAAIRLLHQTVNPLYKSKNAYMPLGGVFVIDVLGIPMESKIVKQWTLENLATSTEIQYLGYPIPAVGQTAPSAQQLLNLLPFEIDIFLPHFIIHWNPNPEIGWWDTITETWQTEGVSEINYNHETFKCLFQTTKAKPHAVIQSRVREYPYKSWNCRPTSEKTALFTLKTAVSDVVFKVGDGWCQLVQPSMPVVADLLTQQFPPKVLLQQLSRRGLQIMPENDDAQYCGVKVKNEELEIMVCRDAALAAPAFTLASCPLNKTKDTNHILVRIQEIPEFLYPPTLEKSKLVKTVNYLHKGCVVIDHSDKLPDYLEKVEAVLADKYAVYSAAMLVALRGTALSTSNNKMENGNVAFTNCVNALMYALRLFSFGP